MIDLPWERRPLAVVHIGLAAGITVEMGGKQHAVAMIASEAERCDTLCGVPITGPLVEQMEMIDPAPTCDWCRMILDTYRKEQRDAE